MLEMRSVRVDYDHEVVVDDIDLDVGTDGAPVTALLGPSGCGKSTLIRAIAGIEPIAAGSMCVDGVDLAGVPTHRRDFGVVFQDGQLLPGRTVSQNVAYGLRARRWSRASTADRVAELLELVGLAGLGDRPVAELSGGQAQRVAVARALAPRPRLLLLDEPLSSLDRRLRERLALDIAEIVRAAATPTLLVTHDHTEAAVVADRIAVMAQGRIVQNGTSEQIWRRPADERVARFVGCTTIVRGQRRPGTVTGDTGRFDTEMGVVELTGADAAHDTVVLGLRPRSVIATPAVSSAGAGPAAVTATVATVAALPEEYLLTLSLGNGVDVDVDVGADAGAVAGHDAVLQAVSVESVSVGDRVSIALDPDRVAVVGSSAP